MLLKRQWLETPKDNKEDSTYISKNQKIKQKPLKAQKLIKKKSISSNKEQEKSKKIIKEIKKKASQEKE